MPYLSSWQCGHYCLAVRHVMVATRPAHECGHIRQDLMEHWICSTGSDLEERVEIRSVMYES